MSAPPRSDRDDPEVLELFARLPGDAAAREELVVRFRSLGEYFARRFSGRGESQDDLTQVAMVGLLNAIDRFDAERGVRFATYAAATIVGELKRHFRDKGWAVRIPRRLQELALRLNRALPDLSQTLGRSPTVTEIAAHLGVGEDHIVEAMDAAQAYAPGSLDASVGDTDLTLGDTIGSQDASMDLMEDWTAIAPALRALPSRERRVLYLRFFEGLTQSEIAEQVGVSQMHVSRILSQTLTKLRDVSGADPEAEIAPP